MYFFGPAITLASRFCALKENVIFLILLTDLFAVSYLLNLGDWLKPILLGSDVKSF